MIWLIILAVYFIPIIVMGIITWVCKLRRGDTVSDFCDRMPFLWGWPVFNWVLMFMEIFEILKKHFGNIVIK